MVKRENGVLNGAAARRPPPMPSTQPSQRRVGASLRPNSSQQPSSQPPVSQRASQAADDDLVSQTELSGEETKKLVGEVMRHMLFKNHQQPGVPVRKEELVTLITKTYKQRNLPQTIISMAQNKMRATFGFNMKEFVRIRSAKTGRFSNSAAQVDSKEYVLESFVPEENLRKYIETPQTVMVQSFVLLVVGIVKFSGGEKVPEETLMQNLQRMGIRADMEHPVFGNVKNALDTLSKQRYIQKAKLTGHDGDGFVYELAERALDEDFQTRLDAFMTKIARRDYNTEPNFSQSQFSQSQY